MILNSLSDNDSRTATDIQFMIYNGIVKKLKDDEDVLYSSIVMFNIPMHVTGRYGWYCIGKTRDDNIIGINCDVSAREFDKILSMEDIQNITNNIQQYIDLSVTGVEPESLIYNFEQHDTVIKRYSE